MCIYSPHTLAFSNGFIGLKHAAKLRYSLSSIQCNNFIWRRLPNRFQTYLPWDHSNVCT